MIVALDYETTGLNFWEPDFRVLSCAFWSAEGNSKFTLGEDKTRDHLLSLIDQGAKFVVHNASFEYPVTLYRFGVPLPIEADTMRLAQVFGPPMVMKGKDAKGRPKKRPVFGLSACAKKYLGVKDFKAKYYKILEDMGFSNPGSHLDKLPADEFRDYNLADARYTMEIYKHIMEGFRKIGFNWQLDHGLYLGKVKYISKLKGRGIKVDRDKLAANIITVKDEVKAMDNAFIAYYPKECAEIVEEEVCKKWKSEKGREAGRKRLKFNCGSGTQLTKLFRDKLGMEIKFWTKSGSASTKKGHLHTYGEAGNILKNRGSTLINLSQMEALMRLSEGDGRWHPDYKLVSTMTGRNAGGSEHAAKGNKLNPQGLSRGFKPFMECLVPDSDDDIFVSSDLGSGEPTVTAHYSKDPNYVAATFGMSGKKPYYNDDGVLIIDDIYLMCASTMPDLKDDLRKSFDEGAFDSWLENKEWIQKKHPVVGKVRKKSKPRTLGLGYSMAAEEMVRQAFLSGDILDLEVAEGTVRAYWDDTFPELGKLLKKLQAILKSQGYMINRFGFIIRPDSPHKALNYWIQSKINGIIDALLSQIGEKFEELTGDELRCEGIIHDEILFQCKKWQLEDLRTSTEFATNWLNDLLKWDVKIKTGWVTGNNIYEAK